MQISPFGERLIVRQLSETERSGIVIPKDSAQLRSFVGEVIAAGPETDFVKVGDVILFAKYSGSRLSVDGKYLTNAYEDCLVMNESDILGRIEVKETANA